jgi:hypothetical protein
MVGLMWTFGVLDVLYTSVSARCDVFGRMKILDVYESRSSSHSSSAIEDEGGRAPRETTV